MKKGRVLLLILFIAAIIYGVYKFTPIINGNSINVDVVSPIKYFSKNKDITLNISDKLAGIKHISIQVVSMNTAVSIYNKFFDTPDIKRFSIKIKPNKTVPEGNATIIIKVDDYSNNNFFNGFSKTIRRSVIVDSKPPVVNLLSGISRITEGGSALAIYYAKDNLNLKNIYLEVQHDGVKNKFKAYDASSLFGRKGVYLSFFSYGLSKARNWSANIVASDDAGNTTKAHVPVYYSRLKIRKSRINITDDFIKTKVLTIFNNENITPKESLLSDFLYVNSVVRASDAAKIKNICRNSENKFLWNRPFTQLRNSKVTATFLDKRTYYYKGKMIGEVHHKGYDLASVRNAEVNAANSGRVVFEGYLGVYGNALIIDHGFGIFSLYGHLQSFLVNVGDYVKRNQYVAITDTTGLALGDHLHFDVLIDGYYVNPLDWWDKHWIKNHITSVIDEAKVRLSLVMQSQ